MKKNIIFITGSTCSGVGKGVVLASIGKLLEVLGFSIKIIKVDPYLNQDAGTMNPQEHGEVWVTKSGKETDTDGGTYFRFLNMDEDNTVLLTAGNILQSVFQKERSGAYQGETVRINPHMVNEIKNIIINDNNAQFTLVEIGGTVGETELIPFISTIKNMQHDESLNIMHINLALTITLPATNEVKIKPVEMFYNMLPYGINIDMQILRTTRPLNEKEIKKIKSYSYVKNIVGLEKASSIYEIPMMLQKQNVHEMIMDHFGVVSLKRNIQLEDFNNILNIKNNKSAKILKAIIIGKYGNNIDTYKSIDESVLHGATHLGVRVEMELFDLSLPSETIKNYDFVVVAGGFGVNLTDEIINHLRYIRQNNIPTLLICFGLQMALIEIAKNIMKIPDATSMEFSDTGTPIICLVDEKHNPKTNNFGGTLRVGSFNIYLEKNSQLYSNYEKCERISKTGVITEKFRHRYWINKHFRNQFEKCGVHFCMTSLGAGEDLFGFELDSNIHKFFVGVQFHPELSSSIYKPHPLFLSLISHALKV